MTICTIDVHSRDTVDDFYNDLVSHLDIYVGEQDDPTEGGDHRCLQLAVTASPQVEKTKMILIVLNPR